MVCAECGGSNVHLDAWADWNEDTQEWELGATFDYAHCDDCDDECTIKEVEIVKRLVWLVSWVCD
jgi:hypothetical protein